MRTTKEKIGQGEEEEESNHLKTKWRSHQTPCKGRRSARTTWEGGALGGVGGRKEPATSNTAGASSWWGGVCKARRRRGGAKGGLGNQTGHDGGGGDWSVRCGHPFKQHLGGGSTCSHSSSSTRAEPIILKNSWRLRSDQDGGSGGHRSGQRRVQVREKATGDLLVLVFVKKIPLKLSFFFVKGKVF